MNPNLPAELAGHLAQSVREGRRRYRKRLARCQKRFSQKAVHNLRIETRRILALLDLLEVVHFPGASEKMRQTFKKQLDVFDALRDTQVQLDLLKPLWPAFPEARGLKKSLRKCEKRIISKLSRKIRTTRSGRLNRQLKQVEKTLGQHAEIVTTGRPENLAQTFLSQAFRRVLVLRRQIQRNRPATIHRARVAFKRFRYTAELLQPFAPQFTPERLGRMKDFQVAAGKIQDLAVLLARLDEYIKSGELLPATLQKLRAELLRREHHAIDSFMSRIGELMKFQGDHSIPIAREATTAFK